MRMLVYGSADFGRIVRELVGDCGHEFCGFINDFTTGDAVVGTFQTVAGGRGSHECGVAIAIGYRDLGARWAACQRVKNAGFATPALIHPRALVDRRASVAEGAFVMAGAIVDMFSTIEEFAVLWPGAVVSHDSLIGRNSFVSPSATVCGFSNVGADCFLGAGCVVVDHVTVPDAAFVKAGSVVKRTCPS